ncbi:MAG TPA: DJ-1/PfpI family protein, partial [Streptosporangiaceae bacterium]|nr:DJ-1/PfpI family protein [Streptosporangiaceae bacterium]
MRDYPASFTGPGPDPRTVAVIVHDGVTVFELGVACDIFGDEWSATFGVPWYRLLVCGVTAGPVATDSGFQVLPACGLERVREAGTLIVLPAVSFGQIPAELPAILRQAHERGSRIVSLCTGAFALGAAGLLDGRRATTHWEECAELARRYPAAKVDPGVLFTDEDDILTSAGSAASIDLCLHLVRKDHGTEIATQLARQLVVPPQRDGGQAQYIEAPLPDLGGASLF